MKLSVMASLVVCAFSPLAHAALQGNDLIAAEAYFKQHPDIPADKQQQILALDNLTAANDQLSNYSYWDSNQNKNIYPGEISLFLPLTDSTHSTSPVTPAQPVHAAQPVKQTKLTPSDTSALTVQNHSDIQTEQQEINGNHKQLAHQQNEITQDHTDMKRQQGEITRNQHDLKHQQGEISQNHLDIQHDQRAIKKNSEDIGLEQNEIVDNRTNIATNSNNIGTVQHEEETTQAQVNNNTRQLSRLNNGFSQLKSEVDTNRHDADAGISGAMAQANIPQVLQGQTFAVGAGVGGYDGQNAVAVGVSARVSHRVTVKASVSDDSQQDVGYGAGVSVGW